MHIPGRIFSCRGGQHRPKCRCRAEAGRGLRSRASVRGPTDAALLGLAGPHDPLNFVGQPVEVLM
jgi:hypothetical protein